MAFADSCLPSVDSVSVSRTATGATPAQAGAATDWQKTTLPDFWHDRWAGFEGTAWYRIDWSRPCVGDEPLGVAFDYLNMAGAIFLNNDLLFRDANLQEPLSRSVNSPRMFFLPPSALNAGHNTFWVQVVGASFHGSGLGPITLGAAPAAATHFQKEHFYRRVLTLTNIVISVTLGCFFAMLWLLRRQEKAYGWYALNSIAWLVFASNTVVTTPWPFESTQAWARLITCALVLYVSTFCMFLWHFGGQHFPRLARALWALAAVAVLAITQLQQPALATATLLVFAGYGLLFMLACMQFIVRALQTNQTEHRLLALCAAGFLAAAAHDLPMLLRLMDEDFAYTLISSPLIMVCMSLILAANFTRSLRRAETFNDELELQVHSAREDLAHTLSREHRLEIDNVRLTERIRVAHDLHDGLGSSLVRSIALAEHSSQALQPGQYLSMFKSLRDDLRQIIDSNSSAAMAAAESPVQWLAPIRHRFGRLFEEMAIDCRWRTPAEWPAPLSTRQQLGLTRFLEEALTNVVKHSKARNLMVQLLPLEHGGVLLSVVDDGVGFDVSAVSGSMGSLGLSSMQARIARIGGVLHIDSGASGTRLESRLPLPASTAANTAARIVRNS